MSKKGQGRSKMTEKTTVKKAQHTAAKETKEKAKATAKITTKNSAAKTATKTSAKSKKRSLVGEESEAPRKRPCAKPSRCCNKQEISNSAIRSDSQTIGLKDNALSTVILAQPVARMRKASW